MPWVPAVILGILGVILIVSAMGSKEEQERTPEPESSQENEAREEKIAMNKRLESIGWGLFLVMIGGSILIPDEAAPGGVWTIGVGLIMLGLNAARYYYGIKMSGFTTVLGIIAVAVGVAELLGYDLLGGAMLLIILGAYLLLKPYFDRRQLFGKAESS